MKSQFLLFCLREAEALANAVFAKSFRFYLGFYLRIVHMKEL
jgi:hypothetical protein